MNTSIDNNNEITGLAFSAFDQSTQMEDHFDFTKEPKEPSKEDFSEEQGTILQSHSLNETEV